MYSVSSAFHQAVANGNEQKALLLFSDCVFTDADIDVDSGIEFNEYFNTEEDLSIGQANSSEINFSLFNDDRLLNSYKFGEFLATLGVQIGEDTYVQSEFVRATTKYATYSGNPSYPYFYRNGGAVAAQPNFPVRSIAAYDDKVYAFGDGGACKVYNDKNGGDITGSVSINSFMKKKSEQWYGKGVYYNKDSRILFIYDSGTRKWYEFCPLGWFIAERPKAPDVILIDMTCYDRMQKFDEDMPTKEKLGLTYPTTVKNLLQKMCTYLKVDLGTSSWINSNATLNKEPQDFANASMRDVLKWIAEAGAANARFNRDGKLVLDWLRNTGQSYTATDYSDFNPAWYKTKQVTKLHNRDTQNSTESTYGTGGEAYLIQDNPILRGVS